MGSAPDFAAADGSAVAVGDGKVFAFGDNTASATAAVVACFKASTGDHLWTSPDLDGESVRANWGWLSPVYDADTADLFVACGTHAYRLDADAGGAVVWSEVLPDAVVNGTLLVTPMHVYGHTFGAVDPTSSHIYCFTKDGTPEWQHAHGGQGSAAPAYDGTYIYDLIEDATEGPEMRAYDPMTGSTAWTSSLSVTLPFSGGLTYSDGFLYAQTYDFFGDGQLVKVNAATGGEEWVRVAPSGDATPTVGPGLVIGMGDWASAKVFAYDLDGNQVWSPPADLGGSNGWLVSACRAGDYVYAAPGGPWGAAGLSVLSAADGSVLDTNPVNVAGTPVVYNGRVFVPGADGNVYCFESNTSPSGVAGWRSYD
jgi:outer membrane protein assembly factor BamB